MMVSAAGSGLRGVNATTVTPNDECGDDVYPGITMEIERCFLSGDSEGASKRQRLIYDLRILCRSILPVATHKYTFGQLGFLMGRSRTPFWELTFSKRTTVDEEFKEFERVLETLEPFASTP